MTNLNPLVLVSYDTIRFIQYTLHELFQYALRYKIFCACYDTYGIFIDGAVIRLGGAMAPPNFFFFLNITILIGINFRNFFQ